MSENRYTNKGLEIQLDKVIERLDSIDETLIKNTVSLDEHVKRTNLLEESINQFKEEVKPIQKHVMYVEAFLKITGGLAVLLGLFESIKVLFGK